MWLCPHCRQQLQASASTLRCAAGHSFDRAREGYVNLLPANHKKSREPGDSPEMLAARRRIHGAQLYRPLAESIVAKLLAACVSGSILDLGCGEGYYSNFLLQGLPASSISGIDISRTAIRLAAKSCPGAEFAVASAFRLPLADTSFEAVVRVFAPSEDAEVHRVLKPRACYLEVSPGPDHLWQLREALYDDAHVHSQARIDIPGFTLEASREARYELPLEPGQLSDIINMTPFAHRGHRERREHILRSPPATVTMTFSLRMFRRKG